MCQDALDRTRNRQNENLRAIEYQTVPEYLNSLSVHEQVLWCAQACVSTVDCVEVTEMRWACLMEGLHLIQIRLPTVF